MHAPWHSVMLDASTAKHSASEERRVRREAIAAGCARTCCQEGEGGGGAAVGQLDHFLLRLAAEAELEAHVRRMGREGTGGGGGAGRRLYVDAAAGGGVAF